MARYIDADNFIEHIKDLIEECENPDVATQPITYGTVLGLKGALSYAETLPTADVVEVKHGEWIQLDECANEGIYCSVCHKKVYKLEYANQALKSNYCPNCGAKMDGTKKGSEK